MFSGLENAPQCDRCQNTSPHHTAKATMVLRWKSLVELASNDFLRKALTLDDALVTSENDISHLHVEAIH